MTDQKARSASPATPARLPADPSSAGPLPAAVGAPAKSASIVLVSGFAALVACLLVFGTVAEGIRANEVFVLDTVATPFLHGLANPTLDALMNAATAIGSVTVIPIVFGVAVVALIVARRFGAALFLTVSSGGALLVNELMKLFFHRPRPQLPWSHVLPDYSFPSGHTMNSVAFYLALGVIVWSIAGRRAGIVMLVAMTLLTVMIGTSRIYLGFHYFTDVIGGALAGVAWLLVTLGAFRSRRFPSAWSLRAAAAAERVRTSASRR